MRRAVIDERLSARIISERPLRYTRAAKPEDDRPDHVRAASGLAVLDGKLLVIQDDAAFIAIVDGEDVDAIMLPGGPGRRRRFEVALGNKLDKLDLEACLVDAGELLAFGSGSLPVRETICHWRTTGVTITALPELYASVRGAVGGVLNIEGAVRVGDELWLFHRGNTGTNDPGPTVVRISFTAFRAHLDDGPVPDVIAVDRYDLGAIDGVAFGFTDATAQDDQVVFVCAAEASADAIADGAVLGSRLGVIAPGDAGSIRCAVLAAIDGQPLKVEGLAIMPGQRDRVWVTLDPDDPERPAPLCEVELIGPWW